MIRALPLYISLAISAAFPLVLMPLVIRLKGVEYFGLYASILAIANIGLIITEYAFDINGPKIIKGKSSRVKKQKIGNVILLKLILSLLIVPVNTVIIFHFVNSQQLVLSIASIWLYQFGFGLYNQWYFIYNNKIRSAAYISIANRALALTLIWLSLILFSNVSAIEIFALQSSTMILSGIYAMQVFLRPSFNFKANSILNMLRIGRHVFAANLAGASISNFGNIFMVFLMTPYTVGIYNGFDRIAKFSSGMLKPVIQIIYPELVRSISGDRRSTIRKIDRTSILFLLFGLLSTGLFFLLGDLIILLFLNEEFIQYKTTGLLLFVWITIGLWNNALGIQGLVALGKQSYYMKCVWTSFIFTIILSITFSGLENPLYAIPYSLVIAELIGAILITSRYLKMRLEILRA